MDESVSKVSPMAHMLYYISANAYMSDYIRKKTDYKNSNVYCVRYLIDTVVSNRVAGLNLDLDYNIFSANLLKPDLTLFVYTNEAVRSQRIENRGKDKLDIVLDDSEKRQAFLDEFQRLLDPKTTIFVDNSKDLQSVILKTYAKIHKHNRHSKSKWQFFNSGPDKRHKAASVIHTLNISENKLTPSILTSHRHTAANTHTATITAVPSLTSLGGISPMTWRIFSLLNSTLSFSFIVSSLF